MNSNLFQPTNDAFKCSNTRMIADIKERRELPLAQTWRTALSLTDDVIS